VTKELWHVDAPTMRAKPCFALVVVDGIVVEAPPIAKWAHGKRVGVVVHWYRQKGAKVYSTPCWDRYVEIDREVDGRWIAENLLVPGVMAYGATAQEAVRRCARLLCEVVEERQNEDGGKR
jgi:hypothetical protein